MKYHIVLLNAFLFFSFLGVQFTLDAQDPFQWEDPNFAGTQVEWQVQFEDTAASSDSKWPYISDNFWAYQEDMLQHSDGDILILNKTGNIIQGYVLMKIDINTGISKWTKILSTETVGMRMSGYEIFEMPNGDIEIIGTRITLPSDNPFQLGIAFRNIHNPESGEVKEQHMPADLSEGILCFDAGVRIAPSIDRSFYILGEGLGKSGFWVKKIAPDFNLSSVDTLLVFKNIVRDGIKLESAHSQITDVITLPDGNFLLQFYTHDSFNTPEKIANLLVWINSKGDILKMMDISEALGYASNYDIRYTSKGILAYTNNARIGKADGISSIAMAIWMDLQGNVIWSKEIFEDSEKDYVIEAAVLADENGFLFTVKDVDSPWVQIFKAELTGEFKEVGKYRPENSYHALQPFDILITSENDLIIWQNVRLDSTINGIDLYDKYHRNYAIKISGKELDLLSSNKEVIALNDNLKVFPNPVDHSLNINLKTTSSGSKTVKMVNYLGQVSLINQSILENSQFSIDVSSLNSGLYHLEVWENDKLIGTQKVSILR